MDAWIIVTEDEDGRRYLLENDVVEIWGPYPEHAETFSNAAARRVMRALGPRPGLRTVRRFEEIASTKAASA